MLLVTIRDPAIITEGSQETQWLPNAIRDAFYEVLHPLLPIGGDDLTSIPTPDEGTTANLMSTVDNYSQAFYTTLSI